MQRAGIHFLAYKAAAMGIEVGAPPESDLFTPRFRYGADEWTHSFRKMRARRLELQQRNAAGRGAGQQARTPTAHVPQGRAGRPEVLHDTWADKGSTRGPPVAAPCAAKPAGRRSRCESRRPIV
jgi:hypothetical protein